MAFIIIMGIVIYIILVAWTWQSLSSIEKKKKVAIIAIGILFMFIFTLFAFQMSKGGIYFENSQMQNDVQNMLVGIFTGVNGIIVMPQIGKMLDKINEEQIQKQQVTKKLAILLVVFVLCLIFEIGYMNDTQKGILTMYNSIK